MLDLSPDGVDTMATKTLEFRNASGNASFSSTKKFGLLGTVAATVVKWQERASMRHQLESLDKNYLNDMGIPFHLAQDEISKPFWRA